MADGADIVGAAAQGASMIPALIGRGQNKRLANGFYGQPGQDSNASNYGGYQKGLQDYNANLNYDKQNTDQRGAYTADYTASNWDRAAAAQARTGQQAMANQMQARAMGQAGPSIAQQQADRQMGQAQAGQASMQASARGAGGMALAQQNAANNVANAQGNISGQAQVNAAQERRDDTNAASSAFGAMRGGDMQAGAQVAQMDQFQAQQRQAARNGNDSRAMQYEQLQGRANEADMNAKMQNQAILSGSYGQAETANQQTSNQNAQSKGLVQTIGDFFSDERAKVPMLMPGGAMPSAAALGSSSGVGGGVNLSGNGMSQGDILAASTGLSGGSGGVPGMVGGGGVTGGAVNTQTPGGFFSDTRAKQQALVAQGRQQGLALAKGGRGGPSTQQMLDDRFQQHDDRRFAVDTSSLQGSLAAQNEQDRGDIAIDQQVQDRQALDARNRNDPAVGLDRVAQDRGMIRRDNAPAPTDDGGMAPGTSDFDKSEPKPTDDGKAKPWWTQLGAIGKSLNEAQFGGKREHGGPVAAGKAYLVGEKGPEMVIPSRNGKVVSNDDLTDRDLVPLGNTDDGRMLQQDASTDRSEAYYARPPTEEDNRPRIEGSPKSKAAPPKAQPKAKPAPARKMTPDELARAADAMGQQMQGDHDARMSQGPAVRRLAPGTRENGYTTELTSGAEKAYRQWQQKTSPHDSGEDYDLRGAFAEGMERDNRPGEIGHLPDTYKKPNHETFSDESVYAKDEPESAGSWKGEQYTPKGPASWLRGYMVSDDRAKLSAAFAKGMEHATSAITSAGAADTHAEPAPPGPNPLPPAPPPSGELRADHDRRVDAIANANRSMAGQPYAYKPGMTPPGQKPGEVNVGPMAQNMEQSPVAATAVKTDPETGLKMIDSDKALKVVMSGVADLQRQQDQTRSTMNRLSLKPGGRKRQ